MNADRGARVAFDYHVVATLKNENTFEKNICPCDGNWFFLLTIVPPPI